MIQQEINLNLIPSSEPVVVHCNQYDEGKARIIAHLYNGSHPYTPGANATVKVQGTKPDNHAFQYWCDLSGSTVTVDVNVQMTAVAGRTPTQLIVNETSGVTGSFAFYLDVQASTLPPDIDVSETDLPILTEEAQEAARRAVQAAGAAEDSADRAASWSSNPPYIGANDNWFVYDINTEQFVDSGILARGTNGEDGERGSLWYRGTAVSGKSADPTVFPTGISDALPGDMYLNVTEGAVYHCVTGGSASVATWAYDFTLTGGGGGGGTDNYNDLINQPKINNVTLAGNKSSSDLGINSNIMLSSIMHIGGETQRTVQEALEALKDNGGGLYPYLYIDSEAGATVTVDAPDGSTIVPTPAGSGHWECELPAYGVYVIHSVLSGQGDATYSLTVDDVKEYHVTDSHYDFTIYVIADSGSTVRVSAGSEVYTGTGTGSAVAFVVHQPSTVYTIEETLDGHTDTETVTSASTSGGSVTVTVHVFEAILNISTTSASLYGKSISIMKGGVSVGSTAFNSSGQATYAVHETGIYTLTCDGYDASVTVTTETTYSVSILAGLDLAAWITAGSTTEHPLNPSSYADFAALEADEEAIRQLMTVHASVDYLAQATAGDTLMESVIGSDVCAKWINLRDYALDTLYANSDIASEMDTADKYFYGEWVENSGTWGAKGNVPIMTANNAPYGEVIVGNTTNHSTHPAYCAFDGNDDISDYTYFASTPGNFGYKSANPTIVRRVSITTRSTSYGNSVKSFVVKGSNDGSTYTPISETLNIANDTTTDIHTYIFDLDNSTAYMYHKIDEITSHDTRNEAAVVGLQFYGRELKPLVPTMTANDTPYGEALESSYFGGDAFKGYAAFDHSDSTYWGSAVEAHPWVGYHAVSPMAVKMVLSVTYSSADYTIGNYIIQGSDDGFVSDIHDICTSSYTSANQVKIDTIANTSPYMYHRLYSVNRLGSGGDGRVCVPTLQFFGYDYSEKEFAPNSNRLEIYDHGVELESITISGTGTKGSNAVTLSASGATATASITFTSGQYSVLTGKTGLNASGSPRLICGSGYIAIADRASLDVSSMSGALSTGASQNGSGTVDIEELYLE